MVTDATAVGGLVGSAVSVALGSGVVVAEGGGVSLGDGVDESVGDGCGLGEAVAVGGGAVLVAVAGTRATAATVLVEVPAAPFIVLPSSTKPTIKVTNRTAIGPIMSQGEMDRELRGVVRGPVIAPFGGVSELNSTVAPSPAGVMCTDCGVLSCLIWASPPEVLFRFNSPCCPSCAPDT